MYIYIILVVSKAIHMQLFRYLPKNFPCMHEEYIILQPKVQEIVALTKTILQLKSYTM